MRGDHLQRDAVFDRVLGRGFDIDAALAAFATLSAFAAFSP